MIKKYGVELNILRPEIKDHIKRSKRKQKFSEFITRLKLKHITYLDTESIYINHDIQRNYKCNLCDKLFTEVSTQAYDVQCGCLRRRSKGEHEIYDWLKSLNYSPDTSTFIRDDIGRLELDITLTTNNKNIAIEFNGLYWHSELHRNSTYHKRKLDAAVKHGYHLIQVFEDEWRDKQDIVKSIILQSIGGNKNIIYARKCSIIKLTKTPNDFLKLNHIQGNTRGSYSYGLTYNNSLVAVCVFGKNRFNTGWECLRYCNLLNTTVTGGFSRLLKQFIKDASPDEIVSYADLRYFTGAVYHSNKFTQAPKISIGYFYCPKGFYERLNRMKFQKHKLTHMKSYDKSKTEHQIMTEEGYTRIYDAGQACFKLTLTYLNQLE